jgi:hypothetical protein
MIRKKPAPHLMRGGYRFSLATNAERVCAEIMLKQENLLTARWQQPCAKASEANRRSP